MRALDRQSGKRGKKLPETRGHIHPIAASFTLVTGFYRGPLAFSVCVISSLNRIAFSLHSSVLGRVGLQHKARPWWPVL